MVDGAWTDANGKSAAGIMAVLLRSEFSTSPTAYADSMPACQVCPYGRGVEIGSNVTRRVNPGIHLQRLFCDEDQH